MPKIPTELTFAEMQAMERTHVCSECQGPLVVAWIPSAWMIMGKLVGEGHHVLCCGQNKAHKGWQRFRKEKPVNHITKLSIPKQKGDNDAN